MSAWLAACRGFALEQGLDPAVLEVLEAFPDRSVGSGDSMGGSPDFERLEFHLGLRAAGLARQVVEKLDGEVDREQAELFARRFQALAGLLADLAERAPAARPLRVGLHARLEEVLTAPGPRALRVRALVDFYTSHAALLHHRARTAGATVPSLEAHATGAVWQEVVPGLEHARLLGESEHGPLHVNVLRAEGLRLAALDCRRLARGAGRDFARQVAQSGALAAVSGGFFLYSEPDIEPPSRRTDPVGLLLADGQVLSPPVFFRATIAQDSAGALSIQRRGLAGTTLTWRDGSSTVISSCNALERLGVRAVAFNRAWGAESPDHGGLALAIVGERVVARARGPLPIPLAGFVLAIPRAEGARPAWAPGARVGYELAAEPSGAHLRDAMAGGPVLLEDGRTALDLRREEFTGTAPPATFSQDETFDQNLLPRLAAGLDGAGRLLLCAVDGRNFARAPGLTLGQTARLMLALGCEVAMNLDGGSSKRMILGGRVLDLPTTELLAGGEPGVAPVRPVHTALLLHPRV
ncbi:MAG: phosphodiester glycosidase family protein [Pseudomonadota bacterium]